MEIMVEERIGRGIYLVIDPSMAQPLLFQQLAKALKTSVFAIQIWDNWTAHIDKDATIKEILNLGAKHKVPVLMNNDWTLLKSYPFDGVHFDEVPEDFDEVKDSLENLSGSEKNRDHIFGITCNNDMSVVDWATKNRMDYLSFCSMFPSMTNTSCELVTLDSVRKARSITNLPIFLAGGIRPDNMDKFNGIDFQGVALVSGIMGANNPEEAALQYLEKLNQN